MTVADLDGYARPPVVEVVAAVRFDDLPLTVNSALGEFWRTNLAENLPDVSSQAPYAAPVERFDRRAASPELAFSLFDVPPAPRYWFAAASGDEVVQLQSNWLACNWRKVTPDSKYARWPSRRRAFSARYEQLTNWVGARDSVLNPTQCEVTYINHVQPIDGLWKTHADAHRIFRVLKPIDGILHDVSAEESTWQAQFLMMGESSPVGRLHVKIQPALSIKDDLPIFVLELTARGAPNGLSLEGVLDFLDRGREVIVKTFAAITTDEAQEAWGKE